MKPFIFARMRPRSPFLPVSAKRATFLMIEVLATVRNREVLGIAPTLLGRVSRSRVPRKGSASGRFRAFGSFLHGLGL